MSAFCFAWRFNLTAEMPAQTIKITGARQHNLRNLTLEIPREKLVVITGLSGSGKSSLAFDTLYAEGQRRYVESLSAYARQFLDQMQKPDVDFIEGLSPAIAIEQRSSGGNPRSTIATTTEIYDYLRLLLLLGRTAARSADRRADLQADAAADRRSHPRRIRAESRIVVLAPIVQSEVGEFRDVLEKLKREGFVRVRIDGEIVELGGPQPIRLHKGATHVIEVVVDRLVIRDGVRTRLADSVDTALKWGGNRRLTRSLQRSVESGCRSRRRSEQERSATRPTSAIPRPASRCRSSRRNTSPSTAISAPARPATASARSWSAIADLMVPDPEKSLAEGAVAPWAKADKRMQNYYTGVLDLAGARVSACRWKRRIAICRRSFSEALVLSAPATARSRDFGWGEDGKRETVEKPFDGLVAAAAAALRHDRERVHPASASANT